MPPRRTSGRRKKSTPATATTDVVNHELPPSEVETVTESAKDVKVEEETETEMLGQVEVSNPNTAGNDDDSTQGVGFSSKLVKEGVALENCVVDDVREAKSEVDEPDVGSDKVKEDLQLGSEDVDGKKHGVGVGASEDGFNCVENGPDESMNNDKEDLGQASENVNEEKQGIEVGKDENGVLSIDGPQLETVAERNYALEEMAAVKGDGVEEREEIAEVISAQESNVSKSPCKNYDAVVVEDGGDGDRKGTAEIVFTQESTQAVSNKASCVNNTAIDVENDVENGVDEESGDDIGGDDAGNEGGEDPLLLVQDLPDNKKEKDIEIYVGGLDKNTVEDDLVNVFQRFGELKSTRIVRNPATNKCEGFAFVRFASVDQARGALFELKGGFKVRGKHVMISASQDNDTLYLGNICKTWKKEEVSQQLKHYGIEHIAMIRLPEDPKVDGKIKGFAFVEFSTHADAVAAFQRLQKPDAVFGRDISAKVAFAHTPMHSSDEELSQVKRVYVEGLTKDWNEEQVKEICKKYGEIVKINLCQSSRSKQKDSGFVTFTSHESAIACVEGINITEIGGEVKIKASIAKPQPKTQLQKKGFRGGFKVEKQGKASLLKKDGEVSKGTSEPNSSKTKGGLNSLQAKRNRKDASKLKIKASIPKPKQKGLLKKQSSGGEFGVEEQSKLPQKVGESSKEAELSKMKGDLNTQKAKRNRKGFSEQNVKAPLDSTHSDQGIVKKPKFGDEGQSSKSTTTFKAGSRKRKKASKNEGREGGNRNTQSNKPFKKQKGNMHGKERDNSRNPKVNTRDRKAQDGYRNSNRYIDPYVPKYGTSNSHNLGHVSMSTRRFKEMEPHAGYIEPASANGSRAYSGYVQPVVQTQSPRQTVYLESASSSQSQLHSRYLDRSVINQSHRGYIGTSVAPEVQPYRGYHQSAIVQLAHDPYDPRLSRAVLHDGRSTGVLAYVGGPVLPASQVRDHTSYYRAAGSYSGAYTSQRRYY